jgi:hypothetical protein
MQRQNNDPFTCQDINDTTTEPAMAHVIKIGKIHALTAGFGQVNTTTTSLVLKAYTLRTLLCEILQWSFFYLVDCLVAPEDIWSCL